MEVGIGPLPGGVVPPFRIPSVVGSGHNQNTRPAVAAHRKGDLIVAWRHSFSLTPDTIASPWSEPFAAIADTNICMQVAVVRSDGTITALPFTDTSNTHYWYVIIGDGRLVFPSPATDCYFHNTNSNGYEVRCPVVNGIIPGAFILGAQFVRNNVGTELATLVTARTELTRIMNRQSNLLSAEIWRTARNITAFAGHIDTLPTTNHGRSFGMTVQVAPWR